MIALFLIRIFGPQATIVVDRLLGARAAAIAICIALVSGCATSQPPRKPEFGSAISALDEAIASKSDAAQSKAVEEALLPPVVVEMPKVDPRQAEGRFDLAVNSAPAQEVFMAMVAGTRYSMVVHPSIKERISVNLKDVTIEEALETVRDMYGYEYKAQGNRILIFPISLQTRMFQVNYLLGQRKGRSEVRVSSGAISDSGSAPQAGSTSGSTTSGTSVKALESSRIETRSDNDFWNDIVTSIRTIIGGEGGRNVIVNAQSGLVLVRAMPSELRQVDDFLHAMQGVVARQVMLEAKIIEVQLRDSFSTGINWAAFRANSFAGGILSPGSTLSTQGKMSTFTATGTDGQVLANSDLSSNPASPGSLIANAGAAGTLFGLAFQTSNFAALLSFLETQGELSVLSSPRIATLNNQKAVLKVGTDEFFVTNVTTNQTTTTGGAVQNSPSITVQPFFSGIALDVTPQIDQDNQIILHVHPSVSSVIDKTKDIDLGEAGKFRLPLASSDVRETDTIVRVGDSNIVAIGGMMGETSARGKSGLPWVSDVPGVGHAFKNTNRRTQKTELVILLKPTIIQSDETWKQDLRDVRQRLGNQRYTPPPNLMREDMPSKDGTAR